MGALTLNNNIIYILCLILIIYIYVGVFILRCHVKQFFNFDYFSKWNFKIKQSSFHKCTNIVAFNDVRNFYQILDKLVGRTQLNSLLHISWRARLTLKFCEKYPRQAIELRTFGLRRTAFDRCYNFKNIFSIYIQ